MSPVAGSGGRLSSNARPTGEASYPHAGISVTGYEGFSRKPILIVRSPREC